MLSLGLFTSYTVVVYLLGPAGTELATLHIEATRSVDGATEFFACSVAWDSLSAAFRGRVFVKYNHIASSTPMDKNCKVGMIKI